MALINTSRRPASPFLFSETRLKRKEFILSNIQYRKKIVEAFYKIVVLVDITRQKKKENEVKPNTRIVAFSLIVHPIMIDSFRIWME